MPSHLLTSTATFGLCLHLLSFAGESGASGFINLERLSERVLLAYWVGTDRRCNLTAIQSQKGLVIIDTEMSPRIMRPIKERIEQVFGRGDWLYVINTHAHDSHPGGNSLFKGALVVGHDNLAQDMQWIVRRQTEPDFKRLELDRAGRLIRELRSLLPKVAHRPTQARMVLGEIRFWELHTQDLQEGYEVVEPSLRFSDRHTLDLGDLQLELVFFGKGHSLSDILVHIPAEKLLVTGAIVYQRAHLPEIGEESTFEDVRRFVAVLDGFLAEGVRIDRVIPSHSPLLQQSDLRPVRDYYSRMLEVGRAAHQAGLTFEQTRARLALRTHFPTFRETPPGSWSHGMHDRNLTNLWRILCEEAARSKTGSARGGTSPRLQPEVRGGLEFSNRGLERN